MINKCERNNDENMDNKNLRNNDNKSIGDINLLN